MFEPRHTPLASRKKFLSRQLRYTLYGGIILFVSLAIGIIGYMALAHLNLTDAMLNASMILAGMGPVDPMPNAAAKWFSSFYAIFSGVIFLSTIGIFAAPILHRVLHKMHLEGNEKE